MEERILIFRNRIADEVLKGVLMPEAQRRLILQRIEQLTPDLGPGNKELVDRETVKKALLVAIPDVVARTILGEDVVEDDSITREISAEINHAFKNGGTLVSTIRKAFEQCLERQAELLKEHLEGTRDKTAEKTIEELALQILLDFNGVREADLQPGERRRLDELIRETHATIFP